jgi:hypothetical protein
MLNLRGDFLHTRVSSAQKSNELDSGLRHLRNYNMAATFLYRMSISSVIFTINPIVDCSSFEGK